MSQEPGVADAAACAKNGALTHSVSAAISARTAENPSAPAVVTSTSVLTYGELEQRANHLAEHLTALGVRNETIVAVCLERSFESIISALAVLQAGGAYLP